MKRFKRLLKPSITIGFYLIFILYFSYNRDAFNELLSIPIWVIVLLIIVKLVRIFNSGQFTKATLDVFDTDIPHKESFYIALLSSMGNFFGPFMGGASIRAVYLKQKYKFSYTNFASTLSGYYIINFIIYSMLGLIALIIIQAQTGEMSWLIYLVFTAWLFGSLVLAKVRSIEGVVRVAGDKSKLISKLLKWANKTIKGWRVIRDDRKLFFRLNRLTIYGFFISLAVAYIEFRAIGATTGLASLALYVVLSSLALLVSITPSAIGIREAIFIFSGQLLGLSTEQILQIALIDRSATFIVMGIGYGLVKSHGIYKTVKIKNYPPSPM